LFGDVQTAGSLKVKEELYLMVGWRLCTVFLAFCQPWTRHIRIEDQGWCIYGIHPCYCHTVSIDFRVSANIYNIEARNSGNIMHNVERSRFVPWLRGTAYRPLAFEGVCSPNWMNAVRCPAVVGINDAEERFIVNCSRIVRRRWRHLEIASMWLFNETRKPRIFKGIV
jgi:hypothetical protein